MSRYHFTPSLKFMFHSLFVFNGQINLFYIKSRFIKIHHFKKNIAESIVNKIDECKGTFWVLIVRFAAC